MKIETPTEVFAENMFIYTNTAGKTYVVRQRGSRFFYFSPIASRWLPVAKSKVSLA